MNTIKVANITIKLDIPDKFIPENMYKFQCGNSETEDVLIEVADSQAPVIEGIGKVHKVYSFGGKNYYMMSDDDYVTNIQFNSDYSRFVVNINKSAKKEKLNKQSENELFEAVNSSLKRIFVMAVAGKGGVCLHSSTIKFNGAAICFSASSGTGKTTHTNLWRDVFPDIEVINGDMGYLSARGGEAYYFSAPWCGTSGECVSASAPVKALVFLEQAKQNIIHKISTDEAFMRLSTRCFMPSWHKYLYLKAIDTAELLAGLADCYLLKCLPNKGAAQVCHHGIC